MGIKIKTGLISNMDLLHLLYSLRSSVNPSFLTLVGNNLVPFTHISRLSSIKISRIALTISNHQISKIVLKASFHPQNNLCKSPQMTPKTSSVPIIRIRTSEIEILATELSNPNLILQLLISVRTLVRIIIIQIIRIKNPYLQIKNLINRPTSRSTNSATTVRIPMKKVFR